MLEVLKKNWKLFLSSPPGRRFQDFHERRKARKANGQGGKLLMIAGIVMALLGIVLLPLPGPGSIVLAAGLMLVASESLSVARLMDGADKKRARVMTGLRCLCERLGPMKCLGVGVCVGGLLTTLALALWQWLS